jgi:hypothetical protein
MLKPTDQQIQALARREAAPDSAAAFAPISHGPVVAVLALLAIGIVAIPLAFWQILMHVLVRPVRLPAAGAAESSPP